MSRCDHSETTIKVIEEQKTAFDKYLNKEIKYTSITVIEVCKFCGAKISDKK